MKNFKEKLTIHQAIGLSFGIAIAITMLISGTVLILSWDNLSNFNFGLCFYLCAILCGCIFIINTIILSVEKKFRDKDQNEAKQRVIKTYPLSSNTYTQLTYVKESDEHPASSSMFREIVEKMECMFYAKLTEDENIELIVKDKNENIVYTDILDNFLYFENHFRSYI